MAVLSEVAHKTLSSKASLGIFICHFVLFLFIIISFIFLFCFFFWGGGVLSNDVYF